MMRSRLTFALLIGAICAAAYTWTGAQPMVQSVLLHTGTPTAPVALTATTGYLDVTIAGGSATIGTVYGSSSANGDLTLRGTSHGTSTSSYVIIGDAGTAAVQSSVPVLLADGTAAAPSLAFASAPALGLRYISATSLALSNNASSAELRIYGSATNYLYINNTATFAQIGPGTGQVLYIYSPTLGSGSSLLFQTDNSGNIGASGATRPANVYAATAMYAPKVSIGVATPLKELDIAGGQRIIGSASGALTGTADPTASTTLVGTGTLFLTELVVGDRIAVNAEIRTVTAIATNLSLTVDTAFTDTAPGAITKYPTGLNLRAVDSSNATDIYIYPATKTAGNLIDVGVATTSKFKVDYAGALTTTGSLTTGATANLQINGRLALLSPGVGGAGLVDWNGTGFSYLNLGPAASTAFPGLWVTSATPPTLTVANTVSAAGVGNLAVTGTITATGAYYSGATIGVSCASAAAVTTTLGIVTGCTEPVATPEQLLAMIQELRAELAALKAGRH